MRRIKTDCWVESENLWPFATVGEYCKGNFLTISFMGVL